MLKETQQWLKYFISCVRAGDIARIDRALNEGVDINYTDKFYIPGLHEAAIYNAATIEHLLERGALIDAKTFIGQYTPIMMAAEHGNIESMKMLIKHGANINLRASSARGLPQVAAFATCNADAVWDILMDPATGIDPQSLPPHTNYCGVPLTLQAAMGILENRGNSSDYHAIAAIIRHGCAKNEVDAQGDSALHLLLSDAARGAEPHATKQERAARIATAIKFTLAAGVSPRLKNYAGVTPLDLLKKFPEFEQAFHDGMHMSDSIAAFNPANDRLVMGGKPTELVMYCCYEGKLHELLAPTRWGDSQKLIHAKEELAQALLPHYQEKCSAELDNSAAWRANINGPLARFTRSSTKTGVVMP